MKGHLPHLSYYFSKPKPLRTEFRKFAHSIAGDLILIEVNRGNEATKNRNYHLYLGVTTSYTRRMTGETKGIGHRGTKGGTKNCFVLTVGYPQIILRICDGCCYRHNQYGVNNTKGLCKETIKKLTKV